MSIVMLPKQESRALDHFIAAVVALPYEINGPPSDDPITPITCR